jgi:uncharacterized membrane protein YhfC
MGLYFTFPITILFEIVFPFIFALWVIRRFRTSWRLVGIGAVIYLVAQMVQIPLLSGITSLFTNNVSVMQSGWQLIVLNAVIGGLAVALCEETARLAGFLILKKPVQNKGGALSLGTGNAGMESILYAGLPMLGTFFSMVAYKTASPQDLSGLDQATVAQLVNLWQMPWLTPFASALERLAGMVTQMALTFLILQVFISKSYWFFGAALLWHTVVNGLITGLINTSLTGNMILGIEVILGLISAGILWYLLHKMKEQIQVSTMDQVTI